jgi:4-hydroxy-tetrahydrodipicolinate synthase
MENVFKGTGTALITPFLSKNLEIDFVSLDQLIDYQINGGVDFLVALGTTAETATLSHEERHQVYQFIRKKVDKRVPLMVGMGGYNTADVIKHIESADLKDVDGLLSVVPFYNKPSQEGLYRHFMALAAVSPVPILLYNVPSRCGVNMTAETTLRLLHASKNFLGIKEASGNLSQIKTIIDQAPAHCVVLSGDDSLIYPVCSQGGRGVISVMSNAFPSTTKELTWLSLDKNPAAEDMQRKFVPLIESLFIEGNPAGVKAILNLRGKIENALRLPLCPVSDITFSKIGEVLKQFENAC